MILDLLIFRKDCYSDFTLSINMSTNGRSARNPDGLPRGTYAVFFCQIYLLMIASSSLDLRERVSHFELSSTKIGCLPCGKYEEKRAIVVSTLIMKVLID